MHVVRIGHGPLIFWIGAASLAIALIASPAWSQDADSPGASAADAVDLDTASDEDIFGDFPESDEEVVGETINEEQIPELIEAQDAPRESDGVEEIIVTATRRAKSIQDVPISMSAISSGTILETGMTQFGDVQKFVPNLQILPATDTRSTSIRIRGIGSTGTNAGIDPSVGVFIDGVYQGRAGMSVGDLLDIERIEVLRGPQGTLFGKNTAAGAMNITTKRPGYEWETFLESVIGNYNQLEFRGSLNAPIVDEKLALRVAGYKTQRDGFDYNRFNGERVNDNNKYGVRGRLLWDVTDEFSLMLSGDYSEQNDTCCVSDIISYDGPSLLGTTFNRLSRIPYTDQYFIDNPFARFDPDDTFAIETPLPDANPFDREVGANVTPKNKVNVMGTALDGTWTPGEHTVRWLTAYRRYLSDSQFDGDFSEFDAVFSGTDVSYDQVSSELTWTSPSWASFEMQGGLYGFYSNMNTVDALTVQRFYIDRNFLMFYGQGAAGIPDDSIVNVNDNTHEMISVAAYAQGTYSFTEKWSLTGGLRLTHETKKYAVKSSSTWKTGAAPVGGEDIDESDSRHATNPQGLVVLRYEPVEEVMIYASFSNGFKSGGFNQVRTNELPAEFDDEVAFNYELGTKTRWFDNRLTANVTGFFTDYQDFQAQIFSGAGINVRNAGNLYSTGFEAELVGEAFDLDGWGLMLLGTNIGFNIAKYQDFDSAESTVVYQEQRAEEYFELATGSPDIGQTAIATICGADLLGILPPGEVWDCTADLAGKELDNAPEWNLSAFLSHQTNIGNTDAEWFNRFDWSYQSTFNLAQDLDPVLQQNGYHLLSLRSGVRAQNGLWELTFWVTNLLDQQWAVAGFDVPVVSGHAAVLGPPRQYGGTIRINF